MRKMGLLAGLAVLVVAPLLSGCSSSAATTVVAGDTFPSHLGAFQYISDQDIAVLIDHVDTCRPQLCTIGVVGPKVDKAVVEAGKYYETYGSVQTQNGGKALTVYYDKDPAKFAQVNWAGGLSSAPVAIIRYEHPMTPEQYGNLPINHDYSEVSKGLWCGARGGTDLFCLYAAKDAGWYVQASAYKYIHLAKTPKDLGNLVLQTIAGLP